MGTKKVIENHSNIGIVLTSDGSFGEFQREDYLDAEARVINDLETMTYTYYQENVKPKPEVEGKKGYVCKICGYVYEGDPLPEDFICPLCKHGASDFEPIK